jgi:hypothetical protein
MSSFNCDKCGHVWNDRCPCPRCGGFGLRDPKCTCPHVGLGFGGMIEARRGTNPQCPVHGNKPVISP